MEQLEGMLERDPNQEVEADYLLTKAERDVWEAWEERHAWHKKLKKMASRR